MELDEFLRIFGVLMFFVDFVLGITYFTTQTSETSPYKFSESAAKTIKTIIVICLTVGIICFIFGSILNSQKCYQCNNYNATTNEPYGEHRICHECYKRIYSDNESTSPSKTYHSNDYGTSTTKCAYYGCNNYIASSGDTNCCTIHSRKCGECGKYIDEDALYCIDCLKNALGN